LEKFKLWFEFQNPLNQFQESANRNPCLILISAQTSMAAHLLFLFFAAQPACLATQPYWPTSPTCRPAYGNAQPLARVSTTKVYFPRSRQRLHFNSPRPNWPLGLAGPAAGLGPLFALHSVPYPRSRHEAAAAGCRPRAPPRHRASGRLLWAKEPHRLSVSFPPRNACPTASPPGSPRLP
jgi:hypothetical protein